MTPLTHCCLAVLVLIFIFAPKKQYELNKHKYGILPRGTVPDKIITYRTVLFSELISVMDYLTEIALELILVIRLFWEV